MMAAAPDRATGGCACFWWLRRADTRAAAAGPAADELGWSRARAEGSEVGRLCVVLLAMVTVVARAGGAALHHLLHRDAPGTCFTITISSRCPSTTAWSLVARRRQWLGRWPLSRLALDAARGRESCWWSSSMGERVREASGLSVEKKRQGGSRKRRERGGDGEATGLCIDN